MYLSGACIIRTPSRLSRSVAYRRNFTSLSIFRRTALVVSPIRVDVCNARIGTLLYVWSMMLRRAVGDGGGGGLRVRHSVRESRGILGKIKVLFVVRASP